MSTDKFDQKFSAEHGPQNETQRGTGRSTISGKISATFISSGIGCLVIGIMTTGAVISESLKNALNWWSPAGPLTGKTGIGIFAWLISWLILHVLWKDAEAVNFGKVFTATLILIGIGLVLTFPPVFESFE